MYCINCGVKLADAEEYCPLCKTVVYHPQLERKPAQPLYPDGRFPAPQPKSLTIPIILSTTFLLPLVITLLCDLQINGTVTWSGYVIGALLVSYLLLVLPCWFKNPRPAVLACCGFLGINLYLHYINYAVGGAWFWGFGFPLVSALGLITTAVVLLMKRFPQRGLYIFGGAGIALGAFMPLMEYLICLTFHKAYFAAWSLYPLAVLALLGAMLIFLGANSAARQVLERKFFI